MNNFDPIWLTVTPYVIINHWANRRYLKMAADAGANAEALSPRDAAIMEAILKWDMGVTLLMTSPNMWSHQILANSVYSAWVWDTYKDRRLAAWPPLLSPLCPLASGYVVNVLGANATICCILITVQLSLVHRIRGGGEVNTPGPFYRCWHS